MFVLLLKKQDQRLWLDCFPCRPERVPVDNWWTWWTCGLVGFASMHDWRIPRVASIRCKL